MPRRGPVTAQDVIADIQPPIASQLGRWVSRRPAFGCFLEEYARKVKSKFHRATQDEDARDVLAELEVAYRLLADPRHTLSYEPCGQKGCDFRVEGPQGAFNTEVKRLREPAAMADYFDAMATIVCRIRSVPGSLGVALEWQAMACHPERGSALRSLVDQVADECVARLKEASRLPDFGGRREATLEAFPELKMVMVPLSKDSHSPTAYLWGVDPVLYTQRESLKFSDLLTGHLAQFPQEGPNVLVIRSHSTTHHPEELEMAAAELLRCARAGDDAYFLQKGYASAAEFLRTLPVLTAALVLSAWTGAGGADSNPIWHNVTCACSLPDETTGFLETM